MPVIIGGGRKNHRQATIKGQAIRSPRAAELEYRAALYALNEFLKEQSRAIGAMVQSGAPASAIADELRRRRTIAARRYSEAADGIASMWGSKVELLNRDRYKRMIQRALGVDFASIVNTDEVRQALDDAKAFSANLIVTIPDQHLTKVAQAVEANYRGDKFKEGSLTNRLRALGADSDDRARLIARDQTAKFASSLNEIRQTDLGVSSYIWRNAGDERVVGNPSGLYPKGNAKHRNHWEREGVTFRWNSPPADGHPGQPIQCRCWAEAIIDLKELNVTEL